MDLSDYPPQFQARAAMQCAADLVARARAPMAYGDVDLAGRRRRFLALAEAVEHIAENRAVPLALVRRLGLGDPGFDASARADLVGRFAQKANVDRAEWLCACAALEADWQAGMAAADQFLADLRASLEPKSAEPSRSARGRWQVVDADPCEDDDGFGGLDSPGEDEPDDDDPAEVDHEQSSEEKQRRAVANA